MKFDDWIEKRLDWLEKGIREDQMSRDEARIRIDEADRIYKKYKYIEEQNTPIPVFDGD